MSNKQSIIEGHLKGIVAGACRNIGISSRPYKTKAGGDLFKGDADEFYVPLQNTPGGINTKAAYKNGLIRRLFGIRGNKHSDSQQEPKLYIMEWAAYIDKGKGKYRVIWEADLNAYGARTHMMRQFISSYKQFVLKE